MKAAVASMKNRISRTILIMAVILAFSAAAFQITAAAASRPVVLKDTRIYGIRQSYVETVEDGYMRVLLTTSNVYIEYYDTDFNFISRRTLKAELPLVGGFYKGKDAYYIVQGQKDDKCEGGIEVVRIIKYDHSWKRLGAGKIMSEKDNGWTYDIRRPFDDSCVSIAECGDDLYIATGRLGHVYYGTSHQGMMLIRMNKKTFESEIIDCDYGHSFEQRIAVDDSDKYMFEQQEWERGSFITRYDENDEKKERFPVLHYGGTHESTFAIPTYATANDIALSADNILSVGTSIDQSRYDETGNYYNVYLTVTPRSDLSEEATRFKWLADFNGDVAIGYVNMTKINDNRFLIMWEKIIDPINETVTEDSDMLSGHAIQYVFVDGDGNKISDVYTRTGALSNCHPILAGDKVVYEASYNITVNFYTIDAMNGSFSKKVHQVMKGGAGWDLKDGVLTITGEGNTGSSISWEAYSSKIEKVIIKGDVKTISKEAFNHINSLKEVVIEDGVKEIADEAFAYNYRLRKITIPSSVSKMGKDILKNSDSACIYAMPDTAAAQYAAENGIRYEDAYAATSLKNAYIEGIKTKTYTGSEITQKPYVEMDDALKEGTDYTITYENNVNVGKARIIIEGIGEYHDKVTESFKIIPPKTSISRLSRKKRTMTVKWKKQKIQTSGYEIQYATDKYFWRNCKTKTVKGSSKSSLKIKKLLAKKKYYVRIRTYKTVDGKKYCSSWSKTKKK